MCRVKGLVFLCVINCLAIATKAQAVAVVELQPVEPQGAGADPYPAGTVITDNRISIPEGAATPIWLEIHLSGWDPDQLSDWRAELWPLTLANGAGDRLQIYRRPCPLSGGSADCREWVGEGESSGCSTGYDGSYRCRPAFAQTSRTDYVVPGGDGWCESTNDDLSCASTGTSFSDDGAEHYGGTWVLFVPPGARGTYTVRFSTSSTYMNNQTSFDDYVPATVEIRAPVCGDDTVNQGSETCDGLSAAVCGCNTCRASGPDACTCCGDGIVQAGEECDGVAGSCPSGEACDTVDCLCVPVQPVPTCDPSSTATINIDAPCESATDGTGGPSLATDGAGNWVAVWAADGRSGDDPDIFLARSNNNGLSWTTPGVLNNDATFDHLETAYTYDSMPSIAADGQGHWVAAWFRDGNPAQRRVARSEDNGETWTSAVPIPTTSASQSPPRHELVTDGNGTWLLVWAGRDEASGENDMFFSRSTDNGATWSAPQLLNTTTPTDIFPEMVSYPDVVTDGAGNWVAIWHGPQVGGDLSPNLYLSRSSDDALTWSAPTVLDARVPLGQRDYIATDGKGTWIIVWSSDNTLGGTIGEDSDILALRSTDNALTWTGPAPVNADAATDPAGATGGDTLPSVAVDELGNWVVAWKVCREWPCYNNWTGVYAYSFDAGITWSDARTLDAYPFEGYGRYAIASGNAGNWVAAVEGGQNSAFGDYEILYWQFQLYGDCNANGEPDNCEMADCPAEDLSCKDCDGNLVLDGCDLADCAPEDPSCGDCDGNGLLDRCDLADCPPEDSFCQDCNQDGVQNGCEPDPLEWDCDNNSICNGEEIMWCQGDPLCEDCNANGIPDGCESGCEEDSAVDIPPDVPVTLNPGGGSTDPAEEAQVTFETASTGASISVTETASELHPEVGGFASLGSSLIIDTNLDDGTFIMTISIAFTEDDLLAVGFTVADDLEKIDVKFFDESTGTWELAVEGNCGNPPACDAGAIGTRTQVTGTETPVPPAMPLGDYGVFFNTATRAGYAFAIVDHTTDFALATPLTPEVFPPLAAGGDHAARKNRYISIDATTNPEVEVAYEVTLSSMRRCSGDDRRACIVDGDCPGVCDNDNDLQCVDNTICGGGTCTPTSPCIEHSDVGSVVRYVDTPYVNSCIPLADCATQWFAQLTTTPVYRVWTENALHILGCQIVPVADYDVRATVDTVLFSDPLTIGTIPKPQVHYGDCVGPVSGGSFTAADGFTNVTDVQAFLAASGGAANAPHTTWVDLQSGSLPVVPQQILNVGDLQTIKAGFTGSTYVNTPGHENPGDCP